jgi:hypothetical protein
VVSVIIQLGGMEQYCTEHSGKRKQFLGYYFLFFDLDSKWWKKRSKIYDETRILLFDDVHGVSVIYFFIYLEGGEGRKEGRGNVLWFYRTRAAAASSHWCGWYSPCNRRTRASGLSHNIPPAPSIRSFGVRLVAAPCSDCYSSCSGN